MEKDADTYETVKIRACFNSIPALLAKENTKFQYKVIRKGGSAALFGASIDWLTHRSISPPIPSGFQKRTLVKARGYRRYHTMLYFAYKILHCCDFSIYIKFNYSKKIERNERSIFFMCAQYGRNLTGESPECGLVVPSA